MTNPKNKPSAMNASSEGSGVSLAEAPPVRQDGRVPADEEIRVRAYEFYLERGDGPRDHLGDWLRAEREYRERYGAEPLRSGTRQEPSGL